MEISVDGDTYNIKMIALLLCPKEMERIPGILPMLSKKSKLVDNSS